MRAFQVYRVVPKLPERLSKLRAVAANLWWTWTPDAIELMRRIDFDLWDECGHNAVEMFGRVKPDRWEELQASDSFCQHLDRVWDNLVEYLQAETWFDRTYPDSKGSTVAYFSLEYGIHESLPMYAGGLGVLAGDHLKSASDMGVPLCGIGLLYQVGYFQQYLNMDGWQQEAYRENDFHSLPVEPVMSDEQTQLRIRIPTDDHELTALVWRVNCGRVPLYLMDTNTEENLPEDRRITYQLYGGDNEMRIRQEIVLGVGGIEMLRALDIHPNAYHMNEGHAAFLALERARRAMLEHGLSFEEAVQATRVSNVFTTHTPVPAGHDRFQPPLMEKYFKHYYPQLGLSRDAFLALGREDPGNAGEEFCMTTLALRLAAWRNGVSKLHGVVSRDMWQSLWPLVPREELPIGSVTNGIHTGSFISHDMASLFDRYLGADWRTDPGDSSIWARVHNIPEAELWRTHERRRERLVAVTRRLHAAQLTSRGAGSEELARAGQVLDPEALTIGFGRRFATYKRAKLIFSDPERLRPLLIDRDRPVQLIFTGKAHPQDGPGKELIREITRFEKDPELSLRVVFIENYDLSLARYIVQGVDVWLNNPRRPLEASGTSGMKVSANGGLNCSILDGWWDEAYTPEVGWAIGRGEDYDNDDYQDEVESRALYTILEQEIIPLFYNRGADGIPHGWVAKMKSSMAALCPMFNSNRMVSEYVERFYLPGVRRGRELAQSGYGRARELTAWLERVEKGWAGVSLASVTDDAPRAPRYGDRIVVRAQVRLDGLTPGDVLVQLQYGNVDSGGQLLWPGGARMEYVGPGEGGAHQFMGTLTCTGTGQWGYTLRVMPSHRDLVNPFDTGKILWATG